MPEPPDFERLAETLERQWLALLHSQENDQIPLMIALRLREVWNARGAADRDGLIDPVTNALDEWIRAGSGNYDELQAVVEQAAIRALRTLDR